MQSCGHLVSLSSTMERSLGPILQVQPEMENPEKDVDSRKATMEAFQAYVKELDSKAIPIFLAQVSEAKASGSLSAEYTISLYEVLARVHGVKIVPFIDTIMLSIVQTLDSSPGSFSLHQACSRVVPAIARYGIDPTTPEEKKRHIIHSLCKPLSDSLSSSQESLASGAALCLKTLVDSDNWRFASDEMVNMVCQNVAVALEGKSIQINTHMGLVMALAKRNALIVEAYARLLLQSGLRILNAGLEEENSRKRLEAIKMLNFLLKFLDPRSIISELELIIGEMEKFQSDKMVYVRGAAFEALQTANRIAVDRKSRFAMSPDSVTGSNFRRGGEDDYSHQNCSYASMSPESSNFYYFPGCESIVESPIPMTQASTNLNHEHQSLNSKQEIFSRGGDFTGEDSGFMLRNPRHGVSRSTTTSPLRSRAQNNIDSIKIFKPHRQFIHSLQDTNYVNSGCSASEKPSMFRSLSSGNIHWSPVSRSNQNFFPHNLNYERNDSESSFANIQFQGGSESVSSTEDFPADANMQASPKVVVFEKRNDAQATVHIKKAFRKTKLKLVYGLSFVLLAMATPLLWINNIQEESRYLVPT